MIGSFLIIAILGFSAVVALSTSDHLVDWCPQDATFYFHLKAGGTLTWEKINNYQIFSGHPFTLEQIIPKNFKELAIFSTENNGIGLLIFSDTTPAPRPELNISILENRIYLVSVSPLELTKSTANPMESLGLVREPLSAQGYLFAQPQLIVQSLPVPDTLAANTGPASAAWTMHENKNSIVFKNLNHPLRAPNNTLAWQSIPQNTSAWLHGQSLLDDWQQLFQNLTADNMGLYLAAQKFQIEFNRTSKPETSFRELFLQPYNLFYLNSGNQMTYVLAINIERLSNQIPVKNFENLILEISRSQSPSLSQVQMPDNTYYYELIPNEQISWQDLKINDQTIRWLKNQNQEMVLGYFISQNNLILSDNFANLVDFLYSQDQKSWLSLEQFCIDCQFEKNQIYSFFSLNTTKNHNITNFIQTFSPWIISTDGNICSVDNYVNNF